MTTQDIYAWIQIMLLVIVGGGLAWYIRLLKRAVDAQKTTIDAQAEHLKAQSTVLQNFELYVKTMKLVVDTVDAPAMLQRMRDYRALLDEHTAAILKQQADGFEEKRLRTASEVRDAYSDLLHDFIGLTGQMLPFVHPDVRRRLIDATALSSATKDVLHDLEASAPPMTLDQTTALEAFTGRVLSSSLAPARPHEEQR